uniref:Uncharacterized protein n=1 Tax=viral metagenome TaxID=1070528 RepID=A0A6C0FES6_9ZZZZ
MDIDLETCILGFFNWCRPLLSRKQSVHRGT